VLLAPPFACAQERVRHALGDFEYSRNASGVLIAAPHGTFDANTAPIAIQAARELQASHLVAWRFVADKVRLNVNRPTEGAFLPCAQEPITDRAREVFETYAKLAGNPERLYVEIHGNSNPNTARNIEVATVGVTAAQAQALKAAYPEMLKQSGLSDLVLLIEPVDKITYSAACAKKLGVLGRAPRALHFEFPRSARETTTLSRAAMLVTMLVRRLLEL
jgi:hypothetical protein